MCLPSRTVFSRPLTWPWLGVLASGISTKGGGFFTASRVPKVRTFLTHSRLWESVAPSFAGSAVTTLLGTTAPPKLPAAFAPTECLLRRSLDLASHTELLLGTLLQRLGPSPPPEVTELVGHLAVLNSGSLRYQAGALANVILASRDDVLSRAKGVSPELCASLRQAPLFGPDLLDRKSVV